MSSQRPSDEVATRLAARSSGRDEVHFGLIALRRERTDVRAVEQLVKLLSSATDNPTPANCEKAREAAIASLEHMENGTEFGRIEELKCRAILMYGCGCSIGQGPLGRAFDLLNDEATNSPAMRETMREIKKAFPGFCRKN